MSTKFILVGGYPQKAADGGLAFCRALVEGFKQPVRVLVCLFARPTDTWLDAFKETETFLSACIPDLRLECRQADEKTFTDQVKWADAIYFRGGSSLSLIHQLRETNGWGRLLEGKTVAGTSAGADMLSRYFYNIDDLALQEGLGLVPVKVLVHYHSDYNAPHIDWDQALLQLDRYQESLPVLALAEGQFEIIRL